MDQYSFFDNENRKNKMKQFKNPLAPLNQYIDWNVFLPTLEEAFKKDRKGPGGRPPFDYIFMFKILILQRYYNLSDDATEMEIYNRYFFQEFLEIDNCDKIPDAKTIWNFRDTLSKKGAAEKLFDKFNKMLEEKKLIVHDGSIIDSTFADVPKIHADFEEKDKIKNGTIPENWSKKKTEQMDTDARGARKRKEGHFGYKDHILADSKSKFVTAYIVTAANVPDNRVFDLLFEKMDKEIWGDSIYNNRHINALINTNEKIGHLTKGNTKGHPITNQDRLENTVKAQTRVKIEHIFGCIKSTMNGVNQRCKGLSRNNFNIGFTNLLYNMVRYTQLQRAKG